MNHFYNVYQFAAPVLLFPLAYWLWLQRVEGNHAVAALIMFVPVVAYYAFVIVGITHFRLWRMNTWPTIKGFRPHHGFVIGTATGLFAYLTVRLMPLGGGFGDIVTVAFLVGSVFGFWNWWYETYAIKSGFISIYTKRVAEGASAEEAVTDYAPILFGSMGACHGAMVKTAETLLVPGYTGFHYWAVAIVGGVAMIAVPTALYLVAHQIRYRESGLISYVDQISSASARAQKD